MTVEDIESGKYFAWLEYQAQILAENTDWEKLEANGPTPWSFVGEYLMPFN